MSATAVLPSIDHLPDLCQVCLDDTISPEVEDPQWAPPTVVFAVPAERDGDPRVIGQMVRLRIRYAYAGARHFVIQGASRRLHRTLRRLHLAEGFEFV